MGALWTLLNVYANGIVFLGNELKQRAVWSRKHFNEPAAGIQAGCAELDAQVLYCHGFWVRPVIVFLGLAARGESTEGRVPSAAWAGARRRAAGDAVSIVEERQRRRCPRAAGTHWAHGYCGPISALLVVNDVPASPPPRALSSARKPHARGLLYFHHGLLGPEGFCGRPPFSLGCLCGIHL
jgi:hypothetical protein